MSFHASIAGAKGAVEGLTRSLAAELDPRIRVNAIAPPLTDTTLAAGLLSGDEKRNASAERHPMKRIGSARDIARLAVFMLSDDAGQKTLDERLHLINFFALRMQFAQQAAHITTKCRVFDIDRQQVVVDRQFSPEHLCETGRGRLLQENSLRASHGLGDQGDHFGSVQGKPDKNLLHGIGPGPYSVT